MNLEVADIIAKCIDGGFDPLECADSDHLLFAKFCDHAVHNLIVRRTRKKQIVFVSSWSSEIIEAADPYAKYVRVVRNGASEPEVCWIATARLPTDDKLTILQQLLDLAAHPKAGKISELKSYYLWQAANWPEV